MPCHSCIAFYCALALALCIPTNADNTQSCPDEYTLVQDEYCFFKSQTEATWDEASEVCEESSGWLVTLESEEENTALFDWLEESGVTYPTFFSGPYIGLRRFNMSATDFIWSHEHDSDYTNWKTIVPYISSNLDNCAVLTADGTWFNFKCTENREYVCETYMGPPQSGAPSAGPTQSLRPSLAPSLFPAPTLLAATGDGKSEDDPVDEVHIKFRVIYTLYVVGSLGFFRFLYWYVFTSKKKDVSSSPNPGSNSFSGDFDEMNSTHNLVEMETRKTYGEEVDRHSTEEIDMGGCFAFGNSSAEEMLASQLNLKVYSTVTSDLNSS
mmetsp:Transcript_9027/g.15269  ORF Transcript_9027/g.15269 Transcript_9027/m.15269 type:complete len:325 (+) Transcript_9027:89-1063(+)